MNVLNGKYGVKNMGVIGKIGKAKIYGIDDSDKFWRIARIEALMKEVSELEKTITYIGNKENGVFITKEGRLYYKQLADMFRDRLLTARDRIKELVR